MTRRTRLSFVAFLAGALAAGDLLAQQAPVFRAQARLVVLRATVKNSRGVLVSGLEAKDFTVTENGRVQPITLFRHDDVPVSIGLVLDNSRSMRPRRRALEAAALAFVRASNPDDEVCVVNFADKARVDIPFTSDIGVLEAGIASATTIGSTALRDAVSLAETYVREHAKHDRRVLLIMSDGDDNASELSRERIRRQAELDDVAIYAVSLAGIDDIGTGDIDKDKLKKARNELDDLTEGTGGLAAYPSRLDVVRAVVVEMAHQIRSQYTIGYTPTNQALDGSLRSIRVRAASGPDRLTVRTRTSYRATASNGS